MARARLETERRGGGGWQIDARGGEESRTAQESLSKALSLQLQWAVPLHPERFRDRTALTRNFPPESMCYEQQGEWEDLLVDGGLKLSELGSCSASVALGSDVAISLLVLELYGK